MRSLYKPRLGLSLALSLILPLLACKLSAAEVQRPQSQGMSIRGDQELPQTLYILPWTNPRLIEVQAPQIEAEPSSPCLNAQTSENLRTLWDC